MSEVEYRILKRIAPGDPGNRGGVYRNVSKLKTLLGEDFLQRVVGKTVMDFGCAEGTEALELARAGAGRVIGVDIRREALEVARQRAAAAGLTPICEFRHASEDLAESADVVISVDAFEHFENPGEILRIIHGLLKPGGECLLSFGPTWYHPLGGHLFSVFPWAHILFQEQALIRWRATFRSDGARHFHEVEGGLNQMTIGRFEQLVAASPFREPSEIITVPIRKLQPIHNRLTREFTSTRVRSRLTKK